MADLRERFDKIGQVDEMEDTVEEIADAFALA
mgnify:CR=1 FL=1